MYPIISISGNAGSGKSTIAKIITAKLKAQRIYVGGLRRQLALDKSMSLAQLNEYALKHPETDVDIDKAAAEQARSLAQNNLVVIEGRTQFYFLPESTKLFIKANVTESAKRIWKDLQDEKKNKQRNEATVKNIGELKKEIVTRKKSELLRYKKYYKLNHYLPKHYDFILDTSDITAEQAIAKTFNFLKKKNR